MGIVDDDRKGLTGFDEFKTAGYGVEGLNGLVDGRFVDAFGMSSTDSSQGIVNVEQAGNIHIEMDIDKGADDVEGRAFQFDI